jgi:hypothetical protein
MSKISLPRSSANSGRHEIITRKRVTGRDGSRKSQGEHFPCFLLRRDSFLSGGGIGEKKELGGESSGHSAILEKKRRRASGRLFLPSKPRVGGEI